METRRLPLQLILRATSALTIVLPSRAHSSNTCPRDIFVLFNILRRKGVRSYVPESNCTSTHALQIATLLTQLYHVLCRYLHKYSKLLGNIQEKALTLTMACTVSIYLPTVRISKGQYHYNWTDITKLNVHEWFMHAKWSKNDISRRACPNFGTFHQGWYTRTTVRPVWQNVFSQVNLLYDKTTVTLVGSVFLGRLVCIKL